MNVLENQSLIRKRLQEKMKKGEKSIATYLMLGYPDLKTSVNAMLELAKFDVDVIEIGFPFSDPIADGPIIQNAGNIALQHRVTIENLWETVRLLSTETKTLPLVMTYGNIPYQYGLENFSRHGLEAGLKGIILPDMPPKYFPPELQILNPIFLASPITNTKRLEELINKTSGFLYLVSHLGITGETTNLDNRLIQLIKEIKEIDNTLPKFLGFGIKDKDSVRKALNLGSDGIVIGSALIKTLNSKNNYSKLNLFMKEIMNELNNF